MKVEAATARLQRLNAHLIPSSPSKLCTAVDAVALIRDRDRITVSGFVGSGCPEELLNALVSQFHSTGHPRQLKLFTGILVGDGKGRGMDVLAQEGLLSEMVYAWAGTSPALTQLVHQSSIQSWNLPYGCVSQMIRDCGAGRLGPLTTIGSGTFVDPDQTGGKKNAETVKELVHVVRMGGHRLLWYEAPKKMNVALLRGTTADIDGNVSLEKEALLLDTRLKESAACRQAIAARNTGGVVIVQVERLVGRHTIPTRQVHIPGAFVDKVCPYFLPFSEFRGAVIDEIVVVSNPDLHQQTLNFSHYDPSLSGECKAVLNEGSRPEMDGRKIVSHRAFFEITKPGSVVNLGVGMPEGVAVIAKHYPEQNPNASSVILTTEAGVLGGYPAGGLRFGTGQNSTAHLTSDTILDFYNGGGIDIAFLGMAEVDPEGNVNVSDFGEGRNPGCGGFIDISQSAKRVIFLGTLTGGGLEVSVEDGGLKIMKEGVRKKFRQKIKEKTFAASSANGREILYITERAVFSLGQDGGLILTELAPGIAPDAVLSMMEFKPFISSPIKTMDSRIFDVSFC